MKYKTKVDIVYSYLVDNISNGVYVDNPHLNINSIAKALSVSETPVREALRKLQSEGYVSLSSNRGFFVKNISPKYFKSYFETISLLEYYAASESIDDFTRQDFDNLRSINEKIKVAGNVDDFILQRELNHKFHQAIVDNLHNDYLSDLFAKEQERFSVSIGEFYDIESNVRRLYKEHNELINALE